MKISAYFKRKGHEVEFARWVNLKLYFKSIEYEEFLARYKKTKKEVKE